MNIDEFLQLTRARRSVRRFKPDPVPDECIDKILEAARWAMSGANGQPWEFIIVKDPYAKKKIAEAKMEQEGVSATLESTRVKEMRQPSFREVPGVLPRVHFHEAPVLLFVCADPRTVQASSLNVLCDRRWIIDENVSNATYAMNLAAAACGLGAQWVTVSAYFEQLIRPILGVPPIIRVLNMVPVGYPAYEPKPTCRRELEDMVHYERYDMGKYRSHEEVLDFIRGLRVRSKPAYPLK